MMAHDHDQQVSEAAKIIEALIFASSEPVTKRILMAYVDDEGMLGEVMQTIAARYGDESGVELVQIGEGFAFRTKAEVAARLNLEKPVERPLSRAALEVLAIIAYHQPITRAEIEEIRGISLSRGTIDILLELGWIKPRGRRRTPGRPLTWGTSPGFLDHFGLESLDALPGMEELKSAGLLRKRQILGNLGEGPAQEDEAMEDVITDYVDDDLLEAAFDETEFADDEA